MRSKPSRIHHCRDLTVQRPPTLVEITPRLKLQILRINSGKKKSNQFTSSKKFDPAPNKSRKSKGFKNAKPLKNRI